MRQPESLTGEIPSDLQDADATLTRYGKWATTFGGRGGAPPTLERRYIREADKKESLEAYQRRRAHVPSEPLMDTREALLAQRALARVPDRERIVLTILYVPQRLPPQAQLRILRIPANLCRVRHMAGLRMFRNVHAVMAGCTDGEGGA
jgi:hypothetical protein